MIICSCNVLSDDEVRTAVAGSDLPPRTAGQVYGCLAAVRNADAAPGPSSASWTRRSAAAPTPAPDAPVGTPRVPDPEALAGFDRSPDGAKRNPGLSCRTAIQGPELGPQRLRFA